jgi:hypothetical protein
MSKWKTLCLQGSFAAICVGLGYWFGHWRSERCHLQNFYVTEHFEVRTRIKTLDFLYQNDSDNAIQELERNLDRNAIVFGPADKNPRPLNDWDRSILLMIAKHRETHPFLDKKHPGINQMVQKALQSAKQ